MDLFLTCGRSEEAKRWNYFVVTAHVSTPASTSELLRRPLSTQRGGAFHEGGDIFARTDAEGYQTLLAWAEDLATRRPELLALDASDPGLAFFAARVQPALVRKGCSPRFFNIWRSAACSPPPRTAK